MFVVNDDKSIYATRGDIVFFKVKAKVRDTDAAFLFSAGDVLRIRITEKKNTAAVVLDKSFTVPEEADSYTMLLTGRDTKFGDVTSKPVDFWYEIELNPSTNPQTIIGYDEDGPKVFKLYPESIAQREAGPDSAEIPEEELAELVGIVAAASAIPAGTVLVDNTLSIEGAAADAKATGTAIAQAAAEATALAQAAQEAAAAAQEAAEAAQKAAEEAGNDSGDSTLDGGTATGDLDMDGYRIMNLPTPVNPGDAVNKDYADQIAAKIDKFTNTDVDENGDPMDNLSGGGDTIVNVGTPEQDTDAANKGYVDTVIKEVVTEKVIYVETKGDGSTVEHISGGGTTIVEVSRPVNNTDAANKEYVDSVAVMKAGDTMQGNLNMGGFQVKNVAAPTEDGDAVNKNYADAIASAYEQVYVNSNPSAEFAAQDIAVSGLSDWDIIHITFCLSASYSTYRVCKTFVNGNGTFYINAVIPGDTAVQVFRTFVFGDNKISVGDCYAGTSKQNTGLIPVSIHVAKFGKGGGSELPAAEGVLFG